MCIETPSWKAWGAPDYTIWSYPQIPDLHYGGGVNGSFKPLSFESLLHTDR